MDTIIYKIYGESPPGTPLSEVLEYVCSGQAFVFPTDTVYGLGAVVADAAIVPCGFAEIEVTPVLMLKQRNACNGIITIAVRGYNQDNIRTNKVRLYDALAS